MFTLYRALCSSENDTKNRADLPLYNLHLRAYERVCVENLSTGLCVFSDEVWSFKDSAAHCVLGLFSLWENVTLASNIRYG